MTPSLIQIIAGLGAAVIVSVVARRLRLLKPSGAWAACLLGSIVFGLGGLRWSIPLLTFFFLSSLLSKFGSRQVRDRREQLRKVFEKGSTRDAGQVLANGGVAGILVLLHAIRAEPVFYVAYLGALAAAAADTWGTEVGVMKPGRVVSVRTWHRVEPGTSGGISVAGTCGALAGATSVALSGLPWLLPPVSLLLIIIAAGIIGMLADSWTGGVLQASYRCVVCGMSTERSEHCDERAEQIGGHSWIDNDVVNLICCLTGAGVATIFHAHFL